MSITWQRFGTNLYTDIGIFRIALEPALAVDGVLSAVRADGMLNCGQTHTASFKLGTYANEGQAKLHAPRALAKVLRGAADLLDP